MSPSPEPTDLLEQLLAEALARFDEGGEAAMVAFVAAQTQHAMALERGIRCCRELGLLGTWPGPGCSTGAHGSVPPKR